MTLLTPQLLYMTIARMVTAVTGPKFPTSCTGQKIRRAQIRLHISPVKGVASLQFHLLKSI